MKKSLLMQSVCTRSQPVRPKVAAFMGNVDCKNYPKIVWNSMIREHQMQERKLHEKQGIMPAMKQTSLDTGIVALEAKLRISSQSKEGDAKKTK